MSNFNNNVFNITDEINWPYIVKKEARGIDDVDFGEVQEIVLHYILTEKGIINKEKFYLPTELVEGFDGDRLRFNISKDEANKQFKRDAPPSAEEYAIFKKKNVTNTILADKVHNNEHIANSLKSIISLSKEEENIGKVRVEEPQKKEGLTLQKKKSTPKNENEEKTKMETERKSLFIFPDNARQETKKRSQSIIYQKEDKAKVEFKEKSKMEADERAKAIREEVEQIVRRETKDESQSIIYQKEDKTRQ